MLPAVTQGVIGIECRQSDAGTVKVLQALEDSSTRKVMDAGTRVCGALRGSCQSPIAAYAELEADKITLRGLVAEPDGSRLLRDTVTGNASEAAALGRKLAERIFGCRRRSLARAFARELKSAATPRRRRPRHST